MRLRIGQEAPSGTLFDATGQRLLLLLPVAEVAVQHRHIEVTQPAQHPPEPTGDHAAHVIISHDLHPFVNAPGREGLGKLFKARQRVATRLAGDDRAG